MIELVTLVNSNVAAAAAGGNGEAAAATASLPPPNSAAFLGCVRSGHPLFFSFLDLPLEGLELL